MAAREAAVSVDVQGQVASVWLERPEALNALSPDVIEGLLEAVATATAAGCSVMTVRGRGRALSAGADLHHLRPLLDDPAAVERYIAAIGRVMDTIEAAPVISVCVVEGYALAGGCELLLACDLVVASQDARIGDRHLEYGLLPGAGGSVRLTRALPPARARRLLFTGEMLDGDTAAAWGLVGWSVPAADLEATVAEIVGRLCRHSPGALASMKGMHAAADGVARRDQREVLDAELAVTVRHLSGDPDAREGLDAFVHRRSPRFSGRRSDDGTTTEESES